MTHVEEEEVEEELSIEASIQQEVQGLKANTKAKFVGKNTKIDCSTPSQYHLTRVVVFVQALDASLDVVKTAHELVSNATYSKKTRFTQRIVPFHATCYGNPTDILNMMTTMVQATFNDTLNKDTSFAIVARVRNNDKVIKDDVVAQVAELAKGYRVDLKNPDKVILIEVFKSICGASIVDDYYTLKKYNAQAM
jgi:tRNA acetyltransferase TAN1